MADEQPSGPLNLLRPLLLMGYSASYLPNTIFALIRNSQFSTFLSFSAFKDEWFARFWAWFGPLSRDYAGPMVTKLLQNNAKGVCLDIGPGTGQWLFLFQRADNPAITKIYGVEPNIGMHRELRENAVKAGLADIYEIIGCGAEELQTKGGLAKESIDTIITVQCLCSIPTPQLIIKELYPLLKHGGQWLVYEHVKSKYQDHFVGYWQPFINLIWPHFFGGCEVTRATDKWLEEVGEWSDVSLKPGKAEGPYDTLPHMVGTLTKA